MPWPRAKDGQEQTKAHNPVTKWNLNHQVCKGLVFPSLSPFLWWKFVWQFRDFIQPFNISVQLNLLRNKWPQSNLPKKGTYSFPEFKSLHFFSFYYKYTPKKSIFLGYIESGEGNGNPLQYSCLENPKDGGAWWATFQGLEKSWTRLSNFTFTFHFREGTGNPLQCSRLENPRDRGAWWAAVYGVAQSRTRLKQLSSSSQQNTLKSTSNFVLAFMGWSQKFW